ncbi:MAG: hypothetical protein EOP09_07245, partial [Proteobacteria bacterium]
MKRYLMSYSLLIVAVSSLTALSFAALSVQAAEPAETVAANDTDRTVDGVQVETSPNAGRKKSGQDLGTSNSSTKTPAAGTSVTNTSEAGVPTTPSNFILNFNNTYYGSQISDPFKKAQPNVNTGADAGGVRLETYFVLGYRLSPNHAVSLNPGFVSLAGANAGDTKLA